VNAIFNFQHYNRLMMNREKGKGSYILIIHLPEANNIIVGRLGEIHFASGWYAYVGSAMRGFETRLPHHLRKMKKLHWHIDYLLEFGSIQKIITFESQTSMECGIAREIANKFIGIRDFGCGDCHCRSHLYFSKSLHRLESYISRINACGPKNDALSIKKP
jgi:Uri superfamily endonuclease